jgi:hypothetical protein
MYIGNRRLISVESLLLRLARSFHPAVQVSYACQLLVVALRQLC